MELGGWQGRSIFSVKAGWFWRASRHLRGNWGGGWEVAVGEGVVGREFRPLAPLGVTEGASGDSGCIGVMVYCGDREAGVTKEVIQGGSR